MSFISFDRLMPRLYRPESACTEPVSETGVSKNMRQHLKSILQVHEQHFLAYNNKIRTSEISRLPSSFQFSRVSLEKRLDAPKLSKNPDHSPYFLHQNCITIALGSKIYQSQFIGEQQPLQEFLPPKNSNIVRRLLKLEVISSFPYQPQHIKRLTNVQYLVGVLPKERTSTPRSCLALLDSIKNQYCGGCIFEGADSLSVQPYMEYGAFAGTERLHHYDFRERNRNPVMNYGEKGDTITRIFSREHRTYTGDASGNIRIWDIRTNKEELFTKKLDGKIHALAVNPKNPFIIVSSSGSKADILTVTNTANRNFQFSKSLNSSAYQLLFDAEGKTLFSAHGEPDNCLQAWNCHDWSQGNKLQADSSPVLFMEAETNPSPIQPFVATASADREFLNLWRFYNEPQSDKCSESKSRKRKRDDDHHRYEISPKDKLRKRSRNKKENSSFTLTIR